MDWRFFYLNWRLIRYPTATFFTNIILSKSRKERRTKAIRRVLVIRANPLFLEWSRLLWKYPDIIWVGATSELTTAQKEIVRLHPDTTIYEKTVGHILADVMEIPQVEKWDIGIGSFRPRTSQPVAIR